MGLCAAVRLCRTLQPGEISLILSEGLSRDVNVRALADAGSNVVRDSVLGVSQPKIQCHFHFWQSVQRQRRTLSPAHIVILNRHLETAFEARSDSDVVRALQSIPLEVLQHLSPNWVHEWVNARRMVFPACIRAPCMLKKTHRRPEHSPPHEQWLGEPARPLSLLRTDQELHQTEPTHSCHSGSLQNW